MSYRHEGNTRLCFLKEVTGYLRQANHNNLPKVTQCHNTQQKHQRYDQCHNKWQRSKDEDVLATIKEIGKLVVAAIAITA
jgi:hypothetical protein